MKWNNPPSYDDVQDTFISLGKKRAMVRILQETIKDKTRAIKSKNPRSPWLIEEATPVEQAQLSQLESEIAELEMLVKFYDYWKDMYKVSGYVNR